MRMRGRGRNQAGLRLRSPAKVNLVLEVLGKRADGYHDLRMLMAPVSWFDEIELSVDVGGEHGRIELDLLGGGGVPRDGENLCCRAARFFLEQTGVRGSVRIALVKRIPLGAGLGGGSSNAATTLMGLERLFSARLDDEARRKAAFSVGADVPFFFSGGPAWVEGIGDQVHPLPGAEHVWLVILWPGVFLSTAKVFSRFNQGLTTPGPAHRIAQFNFQGVVEGIRNDLQPFAESLEPAVSVALSMVKGTGASAVLMSGSGSAVFGIYARESEARQAAEELDAVGRQRGWLVRAVHTLTPNTSFDETDGLPCWGVDKRQVTGF